MGSEDVGRLAKDWFDYKSVKILSQGKKNRETSIAATEWFPIFGAMSNILLVMGSIGVIFFGGVRWKEYGLVQLLAAMLTFYFVNSAFSVFASPVVLRYQVFPLLVAFCVGAILIERIWFQAK